MISSVKAAITIALVSYLAHVTLAICDYGAGSYNDPFDCHNYILCEDDDNGGYDISLKRCPDSAPVFDMAVEGCIVPTEEEMEELCYSVV